MSRKRRTSTATEVPATPGLERLVVDGTEYHVTPDGKARLLSGKGVLRGVTPIRKVRPPAPPKPPTDHTLAEWAARVERDIRTRVQREHLDVSAYEGRDVGVGYCVVTTDKSTALCRRGPGTAPPLKLDANAAGPYLTITPDLAAAVTRLKSLTSTKARFRLTIAVADKRVTLSTTDADAVTCSEWVPLKGRVRRPARVTLDASRLLCALGHGGRLYLGTGESPVVVEVGDGEYRVVIAPLNTGATAAPGAAVTPDPVPTPEAAAPTPDPAPAVPAATRPSRRRPAAAASDTPADTGDAPTPAQKAAQTRRERIARGELVVDWSAAGRKARETRLRNLRAQEAA